MVGTLLGVVITVTVAASVWADRQSRMDAARRQSYALAKGVDRLLYAELTNLQRVATGLAISAGPDPDSTSAESLNRLRRTVLSTEARYPELSRISLFDSGGELLVGDPSKQLRAAWERGAADTAGQLQFGPLTALQTQSSAIPIALHTAQGQRFFSGLSLGRLQALVNRVEVGREGSVAVLDRSGRVLARFGGKGAYARRTVALPASLAGATTVTLDLVSELDQVERVATFSAESGFPFIVAAGLGTQETLAPWRMQLAIASVLVALYWLGLAFLVRRLVLAERARSVILEEFEAQADWLRQAQIASDAGVWRIESEPGLVRASAQAAALFGFPHRSALIPLEKFFEKMHSEDRERVEEEFAEARSNGTPFHSEYRILADEGVERWISARGAMVADSRGSTYMAGTIIDITARRRQEARLQQVRLQAQELFERNPLPFWVFDVETLRFLAVNEAAIKNYGYSREEFLRMTILDIRPPGRCAERACRIGEEVRIGRVQTHLGSPYQRQ